MTISAPVSIGTATGGPTSVTITTTATAPAGSTIVVCCSSKGTSPTFLSISDSASNTYTTSATLGLGSTGRLSMSWKINAAVLSSGSSIGVAHLNGTNLEATAFYIPAGPNLVIDANTAGNTATGTAPTITTGTLGGSSEILIMPLQIIGGSADSFTEDAAFTSVNSSLNASGSALRVASKIVSNNHSINYAPTLGTSRTYGVMFKSFMEVLATGGGTLSMMGV